MTAPSVPASPHTIKSLLTRYAPEDAVHTAEMAFRTAEKRHYDGERAFYQRSMRLGRQRIGMYDPWQLRYLFLKGLNPSVQAHAELADSTCTTFDELVALSDRSRSPTAKPTGTPRPRASCS